MTREDLKHRTLQFSLQCIRFAKDLPASQVNTIVVRQLVRSGTSAGANYRAACRAKSTQDMIGKLKIVEEELDETMYWLEIVREAELSGAPPEPLHDEANEILSIVVATIKTLRSKLHPSESLSLVNRKS